MVGVPSGLRAVASATAAPPSNGRCTDSKPKTTAIETPDAGSPATHSGSDAIMSVWPSAPLPRPRSPRARLR